MPTAKPKPAAAAIAATPPAFPVPDELRARYDAITVPSKVIEDYWKATARSAPSVGTYHEPPGIRVGSLDATASTPDRRLIGSDGLAEFEHLWRLAKARKDHNAAIRQSGYRTTKYMKPCPFCTRHEPNNRTVSLPDGTRAPGCRACSTAYVAAYAEELAAAAGRVTGVDVLAVIRAQAQQDAAQVVAEVEARWERAAKDPNPITAA